MCDTAFIYVFSKEDRDKLISYGFSLIKCDDVNEYYVFDIKCSDSKYQFAFSNMKHVVTNNIAF